VNKTLLAATFALAFAGAAHATVITPVSADPPGSGLNDPTPAAPVGGNPGTTIGEQRMIVYQFAADLWETVLDSTVETRVQASFTGLDCNATSATLGSAGTQYVFANFGAGTANTWYGNALANALAGEDLSPDNGDGDNGREIVSRFNSNLGQSNCLAGSGWYYGLDGNTPAGQISFLDVVMHEIGHGLNFQGFYNLTTGAPFGTAPNNFPDIYSRNVFDDASGMAWVDMTNAQRVTAATGGKLVWTGANVTAAASAELGGVITLDVIGNRPASYAIVTAGYGPLATPESFTAGKLVYGADLTGGTHLGCQPFPAGVFTGKTVLLDRGTCSFKTKTLNAQNAGAAKVVIANNASTGFPGMGDDPTVTATITIPSIGITKASGTTLRKTVSVGMTVALQESATQLSGADAVSHVYLYSPSTLAQGSTFSHFDVSLTPNALMEPFINDDLNAAADLDLTPFLFKDVGWTLQP
jgi:hypothetical protein